MNRVWKGILGIRDLTQIRCGTREHAIYLDEIWDLTALREAGSAKIWVRDAGCFACLSFVKTKNPIVANISINFLQNCVTFRMFPVIGWCYVCQRTHRLTIFTVFTLHVPQTRMAHWK